MAVIIYLKKNILLLTILELLLICTANDILGCGGFVKSHVNMDFSKIEIGLYTKEGSLKEKTEFAPTNGYYFLPLYEKGEYVLKVHPPAGWSFEPSQVDLSVDGETDMCSSGQDINFSFNGFGITGRVITAGQEQGPSGIAVQLVNDKGEERNTVTTVGGEFYFTPVIPGKYTIKATHLKWKLNPSQAVVQVQEGNTVLPLGVLVVKGYDVRGTVTAYSYPIGGVYVLLYSKEESPKLRVEGCRTALLQGVPGSPICHSITDTSGEFSFGIVPTGEYEVLVLSTTPGQPGISYNVKPESVSFTIRHDSLYIEKPFQVVGFSVMGSLVQSEGGAGVPGVRVWLDKTPVGSSDAGGKFTLTNLQPTTYILSFEHEQCEFDMIPLTVRLSGPVAAPVGVVARWRVCGSLSPMDARDVVLSAISRSSSALVTPDETGRWCTYLSPGKYVVEVGVTDDEQRGGLQYYPASHMVTVTDGPVDGVTFSQLKGKLSGRVRCREPAACDSIAMTLRPLSIDGNYMGKENFTTAINGAYTFEEVLPGSVEISVSSERLCWTEARHNVAVTKEHIEVPTFEQSGYVLRIHSTHDVEVEIQNARWRGALRVPAGASQHCVPHADLYSITPRGCHQFTPPHVHADLTALAPPIVYLVSTSHAVVVKVTSPDPVADLKLHVAIDERDSKDVGPLKPRKELAGVYEFKHTEYMADGQVMSVTASSSTLLFEPSGAQQVVGHNKCQPEALVLRARRGLTLQGKIVPPVADVSITLKSSDMKAVTVVTDKSGMYVFGPLDASLKHTITAEKDSYVFSAPDEHGDIVAHKLAEISVELLDDADGKPLQGALVSVSGGSFRRNVASGPTGRLRFSSLSPAQYYVKPNMKEYRFTPLHHIVALDQGRSHNLTLRGVRVAWSCVGALVSLAGVGWGGAVVLAVPRPAPMCAIEEGTVESTGAFRIRGLIPNCVYKLQLKESTAPELAGLQLVRAPDALEVKDNKDIVDVQLIAIQSHQVTDAQALVYTPNVDHYKSLRLTLALEDTPHAIIYNTKLDPAGYSPTMNPGLMYVLPRLPADNKTYVLQLESTLSKSMHTYTRDVRYFNSDGQFKHFSINFLPKARLTEQELQQTSLLVIPLIFLVVVVVQKRGWIVAALGAFVGAARASARGRQTPRRQYNLDPATIDQILSTVNAPTKKTHKKKSQSF